MLECYNDAIILGGSVQLARFILINVIPLPPSTDRIFYFGFGSLYAMPYIHERVSAFYNRGHLIFSREITQECINMRRDVDVLDKHLVLFAI